MAFVRAYPLRHGQAELSLVAGCISQWFVRLQTVTHPSTAGSGQPATIQICRPTNKPMITDVVYDAGAACIIFISFSAQFQGSIFCCPLP